MKKIQRILSAVLVAIIVLSSVSVLNAANVSFTDVSGHWAWTKGQIPYLVEKGVLNGYKQSNGTYLFKPDAAVTRAEFIKMLDETFGLTATAPVKYKDVTEKDWFYVYYARATAQGFLPNYGDNAVPNGPITREEATALIINYLDLPETNKADASVISDYSSISTYYRTHVLKAVYAGIINGYVEKGVTLFKPKQTLTRAEALTILYKAAGCIFNKTSYSRDGGAAESNNVITKGDVTLQNITLSGRSIITEGAASGTVSIIKCKVTDTLYIRGDATVYLENCDVKNVVMTGKGKLSLLSGTEIESLTVSNTANISLYTGTSIRELFVEGTAKNVKVSGTGSIGKATIAASGFKADMIPTEFNIAEGVTAVFGTDTYSGDSTAVDAFVVSPFMTTNERTYFLNLISSRSGLIYYYYTNNATSPTAQQFETNYLTSKYADVFSITQNKVVSQATFAANSVSEFKYVAVVLSVEGKRHTPILVPNAQNVGTGFSIDPYLDSTSANTIKLKSKNAGTLYWYYSNSGNNIPQIEFLYQYTNKEAALRGELALGTNKTTSVSLNKNYVANYDYVVLMYQSSNGIYHVPVVVTIGDSGFNKAPVVESSGTIKFTSSVTGDLYYYYSETNTLPSADTFKTQYNNADHKRRVSVTRREEVIIYYNEIYAEEYPYLIMSVCDNDGNFLAPVAIAIDYSNGFKTEPAASGIDKITFKTNHDGMVQYYFTNIPTVPTCEQFASTYTRVSATYSGEVSVNANATEEITYETDVVSKYKYVVFMVINEDGKEYIPVVLELDISSLTGFKTSPYVNGSKVYFKPGKSGEVWYYYSAKGDSVTVEDFEDTWSRSDPDISFDMSVTENTLENFRIVDSSILKEYSAKYIVLAFYDRATGEFSLPVVINITETNNVVETGLEDIEVFGNKVYLTPDIDGKIRWYLTDDTTDVSTSSFLDEYYDTEGDFRGEFSVDAGLEASIDIKDVTQKYIVISLRVYDDATDEYNHMKPLIIDIQGAEEDADEEYGATINTYGFGYNASALNEAAREHVLDVIPDVNGKIKVYLSYGANEDKILEYDAVKDTELTIDFRTQINNFPDFITAPLSIRIQLTSESGNVHKALVFNVVG